MPLKDIARPRDELVSASPDTSLAELGQLMDDRRVGCVVIEREQKPAGIVTDRDLALREWSQIGTKYYVDSGHLCNTQALPMVVADWDDISFVISSRYRVETLRHLAKGPATPSKIADEVELSIAHISRALQELREHELVDLLVSEEKKKGRVYGITDSGEDVWEMIKTEDILSEDN